MIERASRPARPLPGTRVQAVVQRPAGVENQIILFANLDRGAGSWVAADAAPVLSWA